MLDIGSNAPDFTLPSTSGVHVALRQLRGKKVVLFFYPRDLTPGCTREACDFRDNLARVKAAGAVVYGISGDSLKSHDKFRAKHSLPFDLLSDEDHKVSEKYGVWGEKVLYGVKSIGMIRSTFVIDEKGVITAAWRKVRVDGHVEKVLEALAAKPIATDEIPRAKSARGAKPSQKNRTFNEPASAKAGKAAGKLAAARTSAIGRGYRQASRNQGKRDASGKK